jgi:hypothetical protein
MKRGCNGNGHERIEASPNDNWPLLRSCSADSQFSSDWIMCIIIMTVACIPVARIKIQ